MNPPAGDITQLLADLKARRPGAEEQLAPLIYRELHGLAAGYLRRERPDHTLQATALVHEAYLRLIQQREQNWQSRAHFFALAAQLMRRILVDHARAHQAQKRGSGQKVELEEGLAWTEERSAEVLALHDALDELAAIDPRQARIVEMRYFGGLSVEETAEALEIAPRTVDREWRVAKAWLRRALEGPAEV